jgi:hypothetical protein
MVKYLQLYVLLLVLFCSCEDPLIRVDQLDPAISGTFIDVDSLISIDADLEVIANGISMVNDSLNVIDSLETAGDQTDYTNEIASLNEILDVLQSERTELNSQRREVASGNILIDAITAVGAPEELTFTESQPSYRLPLNPVGNSTEFEILYNGKLNTARFIYQTDTIFVNRTLRIIARNLLLTGFSYDSVKFTCDTIECSSINAKAIFYM